MPGQVTKDPHEHSRSGSHATTGPKRGSNIKPRSANTATRKVVRQTKPPDPRRPERKTNNKDKESTKDDANNGRDNDVINRVDDANAEQNRNEVDDGGNEQEEVFTDSHGITHTRFKPPQPEPEPAEIPPPTPPPKSPPPPPEPQGYVIEKFNKTMDDFADVFASNKYNNVTDDYPVEDLVNVINDVTMKIEEYKEQSMTSQRHLEELSQRMRDVKERIRANIQKKSSAIRVDDENQTIEERELSEKLARVNHQVAQANAELADALRLSAETEKTATNAQLAAQRAKEEAQNIQEELAFRAKVEERRREQEKKKQLEEKRAMEEQRLQEEQARKEKDAEWRRREHGSEKSQQYEKWPLFEYKASGQNIDLGCVIRANPSKFNQNDIECRCIDQLECPVPISVNEELVSEIVELKPASQGSEQLPDTVAVYIPFLSPKSATHGHIAREAVIKVEQGGAWNYVETQEESLENHREYKFAVCEVKTLSKMAVFSRLKRDYATLSRKGGKVTSSYDQRISINVPKDCIKGKDHILMEVQPVDSNSVNDLKTRNPECKGLLNSSPIVHMEWENAEFEKPVTVTVPCPPNPVKAKKIAAMRKAKEEKMKNPPKVQVLLPHEIEALEKEKAKSKLQKMQEEIANEENAKDEPKPTKWYMGEYASTEDDENDNLFLVTSQGNNKWMPVENVNIAQVKLDLLQFDLEKPLDKFMVLRTRTNVQEDTIGNMANEMSKFLCQKFVQVILKQKSENPFDTVMSVVPSSKTEKTLKKLAEEGYDDGPDPSAVLSINEGDVIEVGFRGNVTTRDSETLEFVYNSNLDSETEFQACEVDKYLQKNFPVYRGVVEVYRKYQVKPTARRKRRDSADEHDEPQVEIKRELLCDLAINIPKYHVEPDSTVARAPVTIRNTSDPVDANLLRAIAEELGDEWKTVASHLNVSKPRVQAIQRNMQYGDQTESECRYDMLVTWIKKTPKATDKVACLSNALIKSGRADLAEDIRARDREFRNQHKA